MCDQATVDAARPSGSLRSTHPLSRIGCAKRAQVREACGGRCTYCGCDLNPWRNFTVDHVIPKSRGGTNALDNPIGCCRDCNAAKVDALPTNRSHQRAA